MDKPSLDSLLDMAGQVAEVLLIGSGEPKLFTHLLLISDDSNLAIQIHHRDEADAAGIIGSLREIARQRDAIGYAFVAEAGDVIYAAAKYAQQPSEMRFWRVQRDKDDHAVALTIVPAEVIEDPLIDARILPGDPLH